MEPYINPSFFYWLDTVEKLSGVSKCLMVCGIIAILMLVIMHFIDLDYCSDEDEIKKPLKIIGKLIILTSIFTILYIAIPSKETLLSMEISRNITPDNVGNFKSVVTETVDYIINKISEIK